MLYFSNPTLLQSMWEVSICDEVSLYESNYLNVYYYQLD